MATMMIKPKTDRTFYVVHPLDDVPEQKHDTESLGTMPMSPSVRLSLYALQGYLILMGALVAYRVLGMATAHAHVIH